MRDVTRETFEKAGYVFDDERWSTRIARINLRRDQGSHPERLRPEHQIEEYRPAWQAWLLSPRGEERRFMFGSLQRWLYATPHGSSLPLIGLAEIQLESNPYGIDDRARPG